MGLEPTSGGTTILCLNHLATLAIALSIVAQVEGSYRAKVVKVGGLKA